MTIGRTVFLTIGAVTLLVAAAAPGMAQSASQPGTRTVTGSTPTVQEQDRRARTTTGTRQRASQQIGAPQRLEPASTAQGSMDTRPWTIEQALPGRPASQTREVPRPSTQRLGRVPLEQGTFGLETKSQFKQNEFGDGRRIPGLETTKRDDPSYFGLSLSVPTNNVPLLPLLSPPANR